MPRARKLSWQALCWPELLMQAFLHVHLWCWLCQSCGRASEGLQEGCCCCAHPMRPSGPLQNRTAPLEQLALDLAAEAQGQAGSPVCLQERLHAAVNCQILLRHSMLQGSPCAHTQTQCRARSVKDPGICGQPLCSTSA